MAMKPHGGEVLQLPPSPTTVKFSQTVFQGF